VVRKKILVAAIGEGIVRSKIQRAKSVLVWKRS